MVVRFGPTTALDGVRWTALTGQITAILGPNGAGKSTTFSCLQGFITPESGKVRVLGLDARRDRLAISRQMGVMLQSGGIPPSIRCHEVLEQYHGFYNTSEPVAVLLDRVGLSHRRTATWRSMSGGEQQRLALALALVGRPRLVVLDEPTSGIDADGRAAVRDILADLRTDGVAVVLSTHDLDDAELLADHLVIVHRGSTVASGTPSEVLAQERPASYRFRTAADIDVDGLSIEVGAPITVESSGWFVVGTPPTPDGVAVLTRMLADQGALVDEVVVTRRRLEDVFSALTADDAGPTQGEGSRHGATGRTR